jgi:hypothetical protein
LNTCSAYVPSAEGAREKKAGKKKLVRANQQIEISIEMNPKATLIDTNARAGEIFVKVHSGTG